MLREFINCKTTEERIKYIMNSKAEDWTEAELSSVMEIVGVKGDYSNASISDKLSVIVTTLGFVNSNDAQFDRIKDDGEAVDDMDSMKDAVRYTKLISNLYAKSSHMTV